jgi:hypothetical protein
MTRVCGPNPARCVEASATLSTSRAKTPMT